MNAVDPQSDERPTLWTIGHSTHSIDEFLAILRAQGIESLIDVRRHPGSRRYPHFNSAALAAALKVNGIDYRQFEALGGRRTPRPDSINLGWRHEQFRGYADHLVTPEFAHGFQQLLQIATHARTAIMCAEAVPWRCHRSLIADTAVARGWQVFDIFSKDQCQPHELPAFARVQDQQVTYPESAGDTPPVETSSPADDSATHPNLFTNW